MIIRSLLDTDLYKFTMMQVVLHHFPAAHVEYRFKCRNAGVDRCTARSGNRFGFVPGCCTRRTGCRAPGQKRACFVRGTIT
jgi:hypothetical protein